MKNCFFIVMILSSILLPLNSLLAKESQGSGKVLSIAGAVKNHGQWSIDQLKTQFADQITEVEFWDSLPTWTKRTATGIPLYALIKAAEPDKEKETEWTRRDRSDSVLHSHMTFFVILEARDSFHAFFSLAELMPEFRPAQVYLVWDKDGEPLSGKDAPLRLAIKDAKAPDRGIWGISRITIVDGEKLAEQLKVSK